MTTSVEHEQWKVQPLNQIKLMFIMLTLLQRKITIMYRKERQICRRGGKRSMSNSSISMKIIQSNCDGFRSKKESIKEILEVEAPDVLLLDDTALKGYSKVKF